MAIGLPGYNITPMNYTGNDGIVFHLKEDLSVFLKLTATTDMVFTSNMDVTTSPVQSGQTITDNLQERPNTIQLSGVVVVGYEGIFLQTKNNTIVEDFVATLQLWRKQRRVLRVLCKDGITIENAVCTAFEAKKDKTIRNGLNINLTFQDVNFVVQIGQTTGANVDSKNANGSKGAKAKDGAVTGKTDAGKQGTKNTWPQNCTDIKKLDTAGAAAEDKNYSFVSAALDGCKRGGYRDGPGEKGIHYNEKEGMKYVPKNPYGAQGGNINKQVK